MNRALGLIAALAIAGHALPTQAQGYGYGHSFSLEQPQVEGSTTLRIPALVATGDIHIEWWGQSLTRGTNAGSALTATQLYDSLGSSGLTALVESGVERPITKAIEVLRGGDSGRVYIAGTAGVSGADWFDLRRGSETTPSAWQTLADRLSAVYTTRSGTTIPALVTIHGESSSDDDCNKALTGTGCGSGTYAGFMVQLANDFNTEVAAIDVTNPTGALFISQLSSQSTNGGTSEVAVGQYEAARDDYRIFLIGPKYHLSDFLSSCYSDGVHMGLNGANSPICYRKLAEYTGQALAQVLDPDLDNSGASALGPTALYPTSITASGSVITACYHVPCETIGDCNGATRLVLDTTAVNIADSSGATTYGFEINDPNPQPRWVQSVAVSGTNASCLEITANAAIQTGSSLEYALHFEEDSHGGNGFSTLNYGSARGNVRDSSTTTDTDGDQMVHWGVHFREPISGGVTPATTDGTLTGDHAWTHAWRFNSAFPGAACTAGQALTPLYGSYTVPWSGTGSYTCDGDTGLATDIHRGTGGADEALVSAAASWNSSGAGPATLDSGTDDDIWIRVELNGKRPASADEYVFHMGAFADADDYHLLMQPDGDLVFTYTSNGANLTANFQEVLPLEDHWSLIDIHVNKQGAPDGDMRIEMNVNGKWQRFTGSAAGGSNVHGGQIAIGAAENNSAGINREFGGLYISIGEGASKFSRARHLADYQTISPAPNAAPIAPTSITTAPSLVRSTFIGGGAETSPVLSEEESARVCVVGPSGNVYIGGGSVSGTPVPNGAQTTWGGSIAGGYILGDPWIGRMSPDLTSLLAATHLGGSDSERQCYALAIGENGSVYCVGHTESNDLPGTTGGAQAASGGGEDGFITKVSADLSTIEQATYWGAASNDKFRGGVAYRPEHGDIVACGDFASGGLATTGALQGTNAGGLNEGGYGVWDKSLTSNTVFDYLGSASANATEVVAACRPVDTSALILLGSSPDDAFVNGLRTAGGTAGTGATDNDGYVTKVSAVGDTMVREWTVVLGSGTTPTGGNLQVEAGMAIDADGDIYVVAEVDATGFQTLGTYGGSTDCLVAKVSGDGTGGMDWARIIGGSGADSCTGISVDAAGNVVVSGTTSSSDLPTSGWATQVNSGGGQDGFVAVVDPNGTVLYLSYFGGTGTEDFRWNCNLPGTADWVLVGQSNSASVPGLDGSSYQQTFGGGLSDMLVVRYDDLPTRRTYYVSEGFERSACAFMATGGAPECDYTTTILDGSESLRISSSASNERVSDSQARLTGIGDDIWMEFLFRANASATDFVGVGFETVAGAFAADTLVQFGIEAGQANVSCRGGAAGTSATAAAITTGTTYHVTINVNRSTGAAQGWLRLDANADGLPDTARGAATWTVSCAAGAPYTAPVAWSTQAFEYGAASTYDTVFDNVKIYDSSVLAP